MGTLFKTWQEEGRAVFTYEDPKFGEEVAITLTSDTIFDNRGMTNHYYHEHF